MQEEGGPLSNGSASSAFATSPVPKAASVAGDLPHMDLHISTCSVSEGASTQRLGPLERRSLSRVLSVSQDIDGMGAQRHSNGSSSQRGVWLFAPFTAISVWASVRMRATYACDPWRIVNQELDLSLNASCSCAVSPTRVSLQRLQTLPCPLPGHRLPSRLQHLRGIPGAPQAACTPAWCPPMA